MMAAAFLYNVTGDTRWEDIMAGDSFAREGVTNLDRGRRGQQIWGSAAYLFTPREQHYPELAENMEASILDQVEKEYLPGARESIGAFELPNGKAYYEQRVRFFTTLDMTPDEVFETGQAEVARIRNAMGAGSTG